MMINDTNISNFSNYNIIFETPRCIIRELTLDDLDALYQFYEDSSITRYVEPLFDRPDEEEYERQYIEYMYHGFGYGMWLVYDKETLQLIGRAGLEHRNYPIGEYLGGHDDAFAYEGNKESEFGTALEFITELEIGYMIRSDFQRMGYATEVCRVIIEFARNHTDFETLNCLIDDDNVASVRFAEKLGFRYVGRSCAAGEELGRYFLRLR